MIEEFCIKIFFAPAAVAREVTNLASRLAKSLVRPLHISAS
jgi:hypothetical protein